MYDGSTLYIYCFMCARRNNNCIPIFVFPQIDTFAVNHDLWAQKRKKKTFWPSDFERVKAVWPCRCADYWMGHSSLHQYALRPRVRRSSCIVLLLLLLFFIRVIIIIKDRIFMRFKYILKRALEKFQICILKAT